MITTGWYLFPLRGGTSGGSRGGYKGGNGGGAWGYEDIHIYIFCIIIGTILGFLVSYCLYLRCCTGEEEEEKEVVAPEEHIVEQGGVVN